MSPQPTRLDAMRSDALDWWGRVSSWETELGEMRVLVLGPDAAVVEGPALSVVTDTSGASEEWTQTYTAVWVREAGGWKILSLKFHTRRSEL